MTYKYVHIHTMRHTQVLCTYVCVSVVVEEDVIHERTTFTVSNLAEEFSLKIELNKEGAVKPLLRLLQSPTPETQSNSAKALHLLTQHYQCRASLMEAEGETLAHTKYYVLHRH